MMSITNPVRSILLTLISLILVFSSLLFVYSESNNENVQQQRQKDIVLQLVGVGSLSLSSDCISTRNPIEGIYGCLSDIPGGYCYHSSCDVVCVPDLPHEFSFTLKIKELDEAPID